MKTILLCNERANQRALASQLHESVPLAGIGVIALPQPATRAKPISTLASITIGLPLAMAWRRMLRHFARRFPTLPTVPTTFHQGVNADSVRELIARERPDLVLVSGTDILRPPLIDAIADCGRVMNLHTGISPYIKGGPNCTNWALSLGEFDLIGSTIMWLDAGIDSGALIGTERAPLDGRESLLELHIKVMDHAHDLYCRAYGHHAAGQPLPAVPQSDLPSPRLFLTRQWTAGPMMSAIVKYYTGYRPSALARPRDLQLVSLEA